MPAAGSGVTKRSPNCRMTDAVGASSTTPSDETKIASSAPRRLASRIAAMLTAYESVLAPSSSHGARAGAPLSMPRSSVTTRMPRVRDAEKSRRGRGGDPRGRRRSVLDPAAEDELDDALAGTGVGRRRATA